MEWKVEKSLRGASFQCVVARSKIFVEMLQFFIRLLVKICRYTRYVESPFPLSDRREQLVVAETGNRLTKTPCLSRPHSHEMNVGPDWQDGKELKSGEEEVENPKIVGHDSNWIWFFFFFFFFF
jgi:hypothetical protein